MTNKSGNKQIRLVRKFLKNEDFEGYKQYKKYLNSQSWDPLKY